MDDSVLVRVVERLRHLERDADAGRHPAALEGPRDLRGHGAAGPPGHRFGEVVPRERGRLAQLQVHQHLRQRAAFDELHGEEGDALLVADDVHGHDAGMAEARDRSGLAAEAFARPLEEELIGAQNLRATLRASPSCSAR